ncbi:uncharacterized protein LOC124119888 [Haliotis rufescens]|uniref:uncharacterized protein LOC124119888 n=1 Tax=Haliotis rufescens TaxID=6454 RepID=UPI00201F7935|nr:uncharacterized protein LOC124119888 [Haliotis rufescens]
MLLRKSWVLAILLTGTLAGPIFNQQAKGFGKCARICTDTSKFKYVPGMTYEFDYNVQTQTSMEGTSSDRASLGFRAIADIEVLSKCEMALKLRDVKVYRSDPSTNPMENADETGEFKRNLERSPLRFSFQDGVVEELCPAEGETTWALNIKRGLLTAVQNSMDSLDRDQSVFERDVTGECHTDYKVIQGWFSTTIKKTKDLLGCTDRNGYHSSIHGMQYRVPSEIQSLPLMKSTHECEQELDKNGLLKSALIRETHTFRPFSRATSGATTKILQRLNYKTRRSGVTTRQDYIRNRAEVVFEHAYGPGNKGQPMRDAKSKLREICQNTREDIRPDTARLFSELVYIIKNLHSDDMRSVYKQVKSGAICTENSERVKSIFLDAIPMASTSASVAFLKEILLKREVTGAQAAMWITSLSLIHYPTLEMLQEVKALLDTPQYSKAAMLPISTMVNNYCNHHEACSEESIITRIISTMEKTIGYGCYIRDTNLETSLVALRALGNAGHVDRLTTTLSSCFNKQANPMEVRVAAIQAYRRLQCTADRSEVMTIYQDSDEDSELRIAAYLAVMPCPSEDVLNTIQRTLESEKVYQVGAFVWSHLTNLMETSSPQKQTIRRILQDKTLGRKFDLSRLKHSRNYEVSVFMEKFNTGAMLESNVIFSNKSAIPRSAMFNMTVDLFGNSLNLFELGGRMEGVEYLIEKYLSQYTFFRDWLPKKEMISDNSSDMKGDIYMKFFGNEMYYGHFKGVDPIASVKNFNFLDLLIKMSKKHDYSFTQSMMILDSSMIIPTSSGLPLNLNVNGTGTIDLQASGEVDLRNMMASPRSLLIDGIIKPSGSIKIAGTMSMDAFVTKTGLRVVNTWHSSTALKGRVELNRGKILSANIDFPQEKMEILDVSTEFFSIHGDQEKKQDLVSGNRKKLELCTGARIATITGLELCNEFQWPNASMVDDAPYFPFTGPFYQSLVLYKRDTHTGYKLMAKQSGAKQNTFVQFILNTPGSRTDRTIDISFSLKKKTKDFEMKALTPWKKATLKGSMTFEKKNIGLQGHLTVDKSSEYVVISEVGIKRKRSSVTYIPRLEIRRPRAKVILLSGTVEVEANKKASVELTLKGLTKNAVNFKSSLMNSKIEKSLKGTFSLAPKQDFVLEAGWMYKKSGRKKSIIKVIPTLMVKTPKLELVSLKGEWEYKESKSLQGGVTLDVHKLLRKPITFQCDMYEISGKKTKHSAKVIVRSEFLDAKVTGNMEGTKKTVNPTIILEYNLPKAYSGWNNKHTFRSKLADHNTKSRWKYMFHMGYTNQQHPNLNVFLKSDLAHSTRHSKADVTVKYGMKIGNPDRHITGSASVDHHLNKRAVNIKWKLKTGIGPMDVSFDIQGKYNSNSDTMGSELAANYRKHTGGSLKNEAVSTSVECGFTRNAKETTALVEIKTSLHQLKYLNAEVSLDHETKKASSVGSFSSGRKENKITYAAELKMPSNTHNGLELSANGVLSSPSNDDRVYELHLHHVGGIVNFKTKGSLSYDKRKQIKGAISFIYNDLAHIDFEGEMTTPFEGYENNTVKYQHSFGKSEAALTTEAIYGCNQRAMFSFSLVNLTNVRLAITLKTTAGNNVVSFTYTGPLGQSRVQTEIKMFGYSNLVQIVYKHGHKMRVLFTSNNKSMQLLKVSLNFEITPTTLNTSALYTLAGSIFEGTVVGVKERDRIKVVMELRTPIQDFRETGLSYHHYKKWRNVYATLRYMDAKEITFSLTHNRTTYRSVSGQQRRYHLNLIELTTPFRNFEIFSFRFDGLDLSYKTYGNITFMYGNHKQITLDSIWTDRDPVDPTVTLLVKTPFEKYRTSKIVFSGLRNGSYYYGKMDTQIDDMVISLYYTTKKDWKMGNMTLHTNFHGYELMEGTFDIVKANRVLNATSTFKINNQTVGTEFVFAWKDGFHTHLTIWTPAENFTNTGFTFDCKEVSRQHGVGKLNIRYRDDKVITFRFTVLSPVNESRSVKAELITPITGYERQHILFTDRSKSYKTFKNNITFLNSKGEQLTLSSDFALYSFIDINLFFKSKEIKGRDLVKLSLRNPTVGNCTVKVETKVPLVGFENCVLYYHHFIVDGSLEAALKLESNGSKYIATNIYSTFSTNKFDGSVVIDSDVYTFRNITVVLQKERVINNVRAKGYIMVAESTYESSVTQVIIPGKLRKLNGVMVINWDRKNPESNIELQAKLMDRSRQSLLNKDLILKLIRTQRTVGIIGNVLSSQLQTKSHGEFIWNEAAGHKLFYDVNVKDRSRRNSKMFDSSLKVGSPLRSLQMDGSYSQTGSSQTVDGAFSWDADKDNTKKIAMKAIFTPDDKNKQADLSLRLPSIGKNIQLDTAMLLNDGRTVFNGKTQVSYSSDSRKTLTLTSRMDDISYGYGNSNYSFVVGISHPYTDVDVKLTSHIGSSSEKVSAGMDIAYLTASRERKNFALEGHLNTEMQMLKLKMQCPIKQLEASVEMGENPFKIVINNRTLATGLTSWRAVELETRFDLDNPERMIHVDARYVNSSAMQAGVYHQENSSRVSDSIVALRLNTSRLLHARISWRPQMIADVQAYLTRAVERNGENGKTTLDSVYESVGQELSGKYHRIAQATKEELSPYLNLLESEMATIEKQLDSIRRDMKRMYDRNDFYMADMGYYSEAGKKLYKHLVKTIFRRFIRGTRSMTEHLQNANDLNVKEFYDHLLNDWVVLAKEKVDTTVEDAVEMISSLDDMIQNMWDIYQHHYNIVQMKATATVDTIMDLPHIVDSKFEISNSISPYMDRLYSTTVKTYGSFKDLLMNSGDMISSHLINAEQRSDLQMLFSITNNAYQEGGSILEEHLQKIPNLVKRELTNYTRDALTIYNPQITAWDPEHGEIQIELCLPIPLRSLDRLPDVQPYVQNAKATVSKYIPDKTTLERLYKNYSAWRSNRTNGR